MCPDGGSSPQQKPTEPYWLGALFTEKQEYLIVVKHLLSEFSVFFFFFTQILSYWICHQDSVQEQVQEEIPAKCQGIYYENNDCVVVATTTIQFAFDGKNSIKYTILGSFFNVFILHPLSPIQLSAIRKNLQNVFAAPSNETLVHMHWMNAVFPQVYLKQVCVLRSREAPIPIFSGM